MDKQTGKNGNRGKPGPGRPKGSVNKTTALMKDAILAAAVQAGNDLKPGGGMEAYLVQQAKDQPVAFMGLMGKVLPMQVNHGDADGGALTIQVVRFADDPAS